MKFLLIDKIVELDPGRSLVAVKNLTLAEEYLADHFPGFPVMPGVLMIEAMTQAGAWLIRASEDFRHSVVLLKSARTIKYGSFVEPGRQLRIHVEVAKHDESETQIKGRGTVDDQVMVQGKLTLARRNLRDADPSMAATDSAIIARQREIFGSIARGLAIGGAGPASPGAA